MLTSQEAKRTRDLHRPISQGVSSNKIGDLEVHEGLLSKNAAFCISVRGWRGAETEMVTRSKRIVAAFKRMIMAVEKWREN